MMDAPPAIVVDGDTLRIGAESDSPLDIDAPEMAASGLAKAKFAEIVAGQALEIDRRG